MSWKDDFFQEERFKVAGGPGSGVSRNNTEEIKDMPQSDHVSVGTRTGLLRNMSYKKMSVRLSYITHVGQSKFVPSKLKKMVANWKEVKKNPIDLLKVSDHEYHVIDGHHRFLAAKQLGEKTVNARVYEKRKEKTADLKKIFDDYFKPALKDKLDKIKDRKGEFELELSGFRGNGFEKTYKFLENISSADSIGCKVDDEKNFDWQGCEIIPRISNPDPNDIRITVKGGAKEIGILKTLFKEISKINSGTSGNFYINGKSIYSLDGDGADRVALKTKCDLPIEKNASIEQDDKELQKHLTYVKTYMKENRINNFMVVASRDKDSKGHSITFNNGNETIKKLRENLSKIEIKNGEDPSYDWSKNKTASTTNLFDEYSKKNRTVVKASDFDTLLRNFENNILVDLDNVIHDMDKYDDNKIDGKPVDGAKEYIQKLISSGKHIYILSARSCRDFDSKKKLISDWLDKNDIPYDDVVDKKVPASVFIDDRAISFHGSWEDAYEEAVDFKPVQNQGKDKLLKHTKFVELRMKVDKDNGVDGYIYAHESACNGKKIAIMPYRRAGRDAWEVLLRDEITPAWGMKPVLSSITGSMDNPDESPIEAARRELKEETGFTVDVKDIKSLGNCFGSKAMDTVYHLFSVDVTGKKPSKPSGDGSKLEAMAKNRFVKKVSDKTWVFDSYKTKDPIAAMLITRMQGYTEDTKSPVHKKKLLEELSEVVHEQWMDLAKGVIATEPNLTDKRKRRWSKYFVDYEKLDEFNKEKDRSWGRKYLDVIEKNGSVKKTEDGWSVLSEKGKILGSGYKTKEEAALRLRQIEYFKHLKNK